MSNKFQRNLHSNSVYKILDISADLPLAPGDTLYSEDIPAGFWSERGFKLTLNTLSCQIKLKIEVSYDKRAPRDFGPVFHSLLQTPLEFTIASTATDPAPLSFSEAFRGDWIRFSIENTGSNPIEDLDLTSTLANSPDF